MAAPLAAWRPALVSSARLLVARIPEWAGTSTRHLWEKPGMAIPHAKPGEIVDVRPFGSAFASARTSTLVRAGQIELIRLVVCWQENRGASGQRRPCRALPGGSGRRLTT